MFSKPSALVNFAFQAEKRVIQDLSRASSVSCMKKFIEILDGTSNELCRVADASDCLRHIHSSRVWQQAATVSFTRINLLMNQLNSNTNLSQVTQNNLFDHFVCKF
jgi:Zn-dependent oligopeptidase